ncbi:MAG: class I SAM-dependent methyltransferase [Gammaproteobacteria bacterium]|nr:class I SAM-dependent methyltransferase [Gammaproteobacteria bacterium]
MPRKRKKLPKKRPAQKKPAGKSMAETADRHRLYQLAVQCVESEIDMVDDTYKEIRGRRAVHLREDFCGTANTGCEWVRRRDGNTATGVDLDEDVLDWGRRENLGKLSEAQQSRIELLRKDVREKGVAKPADITVAMNFSYMCFKTRDDLRGYFAAAHAGLADDGVFLIDAYGGSESWCDTREKTKCDGFTYLWEQCNFNPINGHINCHIHFRFPDGSKIRRAFSYEWRMWTLPEIREIMHEAGFAKTIVYWEGTDEETGEGNDIYEPSEVGEDDPSWIVYVAAVK